MAYLNVPFLSVDKERDLQVAVPADRHLPDPGTGTSAPRAPEIRSRISGNITPLSMNLIPRTG